MDLVSKTIHIKVVSFFFFGVGLSTIILNSVINLPMNQGKLKNQQHQRNKIAKKKCILVIYTLFLPCFLESGVERLISGNSYSITHFYFVEAAITLWTKALKYYKFFYFELSR